MAATLTELSQRNEAFWIGVALFVLGIITPEALFLGELELSRVLIWIGGGILLTKALVGIYRILKTALLNSGAGRDSRDLGWLVRS